MAARWPRFEDAHQHLRALVEAALAAAEPAAAVRRHLRRQGQWLLAGDERVRLDQGRLCLIAVGKAAVPMASAAAEVVGAYLDGGVIISKQLLETTEGLLPTYQGGHPVPDERSLAATEAAVALLRERQEGDVVLCLISGGASALLTQPRISLDDWQHLTGALLASGCTIGELNMVRKQLDRVKGGGLARLASPATVVSLILSDVVGNRLDMIGSGPTAPDASRPADALAVLEKVGVGHRLGEEPYRRIVGELQMTGGRGQGTDAMGQVVNIIVGDVRAAAEAAAARAEALGFRARLLTTQLEGEAREVGRVVAALARDAPAGSCTILGGETTVTVRGQGQGGRNLELALAAALALDGTPNAVVASFATDGEDGTTGAAGALVNGETARLARACGLDPVAYLENNDSYGFFTELDTRSGTQQLIRTGPTGTNVNDLVLILRYDA